MKTKPHFLYFASFPTADSENGTSPHIYNAELASPGLRTLFVGACSPRIENATDRTLPPRRIGKDVKRIGLRVRSDISAVGSRWRYPIYADGNHVAGADIVSSAYFPSS